MTGDNTHWFDRFSTTLSQHLPRWELLGLRWRIGHGS
jgi:hypothetical protein